MSSLLASPRNIAAIFRGPLQASGFAPTCGCHFTTVLVSFRQAPRAALGVDEDVRLQHADGYDVARFRCVVGHCERGNECLDREEKRRERGDGTRGNARSDRGCFFMTYTPCAHENNNHKKGKNLEVRFLRFVPAATGHIEMRRGEGKGENLAISVIIDTRTYNLSPSTR